MEEEENQIVLFEYNTRNDLAMSTPMGEAIVGLDAAIRETARLEVEAFIEETGETFTETELEALVVVQELSGINAVDLGVIILKASRIKHIQRGNLATRHPAGYQSLAELAAENGLSGSELSNILDWVDVIFPFLVELGFSIGVLWRRLGKSKFREITPILKVLVTGEPSGASTVNDAVDAILDNVAASTAVSGEDQLDDEAARMLGARWVVEQAENLTIPQLRREVRPTRTPVIQGSLIPVNNGEGGRVAMMYLTHEQWILLHRVAGNHIELLPIILPDDPELREEESRNIPEMRRILREVSV
jgi:hypothetical protein